MNHIFYEKEGRIGHIILNRPKTHNAFNDEMIEEFSSLLRSIAGDPSVRVVLLRAHGSNFCAGADLHWMKKMANYSEEENYADAMSLAQLFFLLATLPKPTVCLAQGSSFGGGVGLVASCDISICAQDALFSLSEVKLGLIPAVISPYVQRAIGEKRAARYFLTGERFGAGQALEMGLVDEIGDNIREKGEKLCSILLKNGPLAMAAVKEKLSVFSTDNHKTVMEKTSRAIAQLRVSKEGREGISAFLEKRSPQWKE